MTEPILANTYNNLVRRMARNIFISTFLSFVSLVIAEADNSSQCWWSVKNRSEFMCMFYRLEIYDPNYCYRNCQWKTICAAKVWNFICFCFIWFRPLHRILVHILLWFYYPFDVGNLADFIIDSDFVYENWQCRINFFASMDINIIAVVVVVG